MLKKNIDPSIIKNTTHFDFNDRNFDIVRFIQVNSFPAIPEHLTAKIYVDNAISYSVDESSLLKLDSDEKLKPDEQDFIVLNSALTSPKTIIELPTKSYVESLHESSRESRDLSSVINDQDIEFDNNKITNLDSVTNRRSPSSDNEVSNKKYVDDELNKKIIVRFNQTLQNSLKVSAGDDTYNLTKYDRIQITDTTEMRYPNIGSDLLQKWNIKCINKNSQSRITDFIEST